MTTQNGARHSCTWARRIISDYIFRVAILSNITLHDPFLRIIIWTTRLLYCPQLCPWLMTAFGLSIYLIVRARKGFNLKRLPTMLEESNETIFQMKDAKYFSFKELQLNMDNWLKSHIIYKKHSLKTVHTETNKTIVEVDIHCCHGWRLQ